MKIETKRIRLVSTDERTHQDVPLLVDGLLDLLAEVSLRDLEVLAGLPGVVHQREEPVVHADELEVAAGHVGHVHVVGGRADVLVLLVGEDVEGHHVDLGVAVLASLGSGHLHDLARVALEGRTRQRSMSSRVKRRKPKR